MLRPSYTDLLEVLSKEGLDSDDKISRYTIVIAAAKRARQLIDDPEAMKQYGMDKPVSIAVKELYEGKIRIVMPEEKEEEENFEPQEITAEAPAEEISAAE